MKIKSISFYLGIFCFPISILSFINILYSSYFDYFLSIESYFITLAISLIFGSIIIFAFGIIYLGSIIGYEKAIVVGLLPFIPSELFKIALAVALIPTIQKIIKK